MTASRIAPLRQGVCGSCIVVWLVAVPLSGALGFYALFMVFA